MSGRILLFLSERLKRTDVGFGEKLRLVSKLAPQLDVTGEAQALRLLLESALMTRPSYGDLYALCEMSETSKVLHDYLRGFFLHGEVDERRVEMALRLEGVMSFRTAQNKISVPSKKLHQTIADYLLRARN